MLNYAKCLATAESPKVVQVMGGGGGGGTPTLFFFRLQKFPQNYHNGVGVLSSWTWLTAELTSKKKKNHSRNLVAYGYTSVANNTNSFYGTLRTDDVLQS